MSYFVALFLQHEGGDLGWLFARDHVPQMVKRCRHTTWLGLDHVTLFKCLSSSPHD
jgi:hypothetical protein